MRLGVKKLIIPLMVFACTACGSSSQSPPSTNKDNVEPSPIVVSRGEGSSIRLRDMLTSKYENQILLQFVVPFFIDKENIEVVSDPDYKNLEINARAFLSDAAELKYGKSFRYPRKHSTFINGDLDLENGDYICAKDVMQKFARDILWTIQGDGYLMPEESLKVTVEFYTITGTVKTDKYGNEDYSGQKEKVLVKTLIHISTPELNKISDAYAVDDYYELSDLSKPVRHLSSWNQCRSGTS